MNLNVDRELSESEVINQSVSELRTMAREQRSGFWAAALSDAAILIESQFKELEELRYLIGEVERGDKIRDEEIISWRRVAEKYKAEADMLKAVLDGE